MATPERVEMDEAPVDERTTGEQEKEVAKLRVDVEEARLRAELAKLTPTAPPDIGEQVTALAELVGQFQAAQNDLTGQLGILTNRVAALEKPA